MSEEVLDINEFLERVQNDKELLVELLDIFVEDYTEKRNSLKQAFDGKDYEQVKSIAHSLKGASGNISAKALRETLLKVEEMGKSNDLSDADNTLATMDQQFEELSAKINSVKEEYQN